MFNLIIIMTFITSILLFYTIFKFLMVKQKSIIRLKKYININEIKEAKKKSIRKANKTRFGILSKTIGNTKALDGYKKKIQQKLMRAHILLKAEEFITISIMLFLIFGFLAFTMTGSKSPASRFFIVIITGIVGWIAPFIFLKLKIKKRIKILNEQLADAVVLISNSLKAGCSFFQSIMVVAEEMSGPISEEFILLMKEINLGVTTEKALENLVSRVSSDDLELMVTAVLIQRQVGGNLAEILDNISTTIRERVKIKGEIKTITAQGKMSGLIISILPPGLGVLIFFINPEHMKSMLTNPLGIGILVFSVIMELIGIFCISRIIKIEM